MNCTYCDGEFGPLPPIAVFADTALVAELCSPRCLSDWATHIYLAETEEDTIGELPTV